MAERKPLVAGLKAIDEINPVLEKKFVFGERADTSAENRETVNSSTPGREQLTTKIRSDYLHALKRVSLERQLAGQKPHTVQECVEQALEPWLKANGYLA